MSKSILIRLNYGDRLCLCDSVEKFSALINQLCKLQTFDSVSSDFFEILAESYVFLAQIRNIVGVEAGSFYSLVDSKFSLLDDYYDYDVVL